VSLSTGTGLERRVRGSNPKGRIKVQYGSKKRNGQEKNGKGFLLPIVKGKNAMSELFVVWNGMGLKRKQRRRISGGESEDGNTD